MEFCLKFEVKDAMPGPEGGKPSSCRSRSPWGCSAQFEVQEILQPIWSKMNTSFRLKSA